ncbi:MAG: hypothetical protein RIQ53_1034 [Pseudomonadota bacterium]|jgi:hypothetical protein
MTAACRTARPLHHTAPPADSPVDAGRRRLLRAGRLLPLGAAPLLAALGGCATLGQLSILVASHGRWPGDAALQRFRWDRLPSQQDDAARTAQVEAAALPALQRVGLELATDGAPPTLGVQLAVRRALVGPAAWEDPRFWPAPAWRVGVGVQLGGGSRPGWGVSSRWPWPPEPARESWEVTVLLRQLADAQPLYEARARLEGYASPATESLWRTLFSAALSDAPQARPEPHTVRLAPVA